MDSADCLVTDSGFVRSELLQLFRLPSERVIAIPLGVDAAFAPHAAGAGTDPGRLWLATRRLPAQRGHHQARKNLTGLLRAFLQLAPTQRRQCPW